MGKRLYVATKHDVEYNSNGVFNWKFNEFKTLLNSLSVDIIEEDEYSDYWSVLKEQFKKAINILKDYKNQIIKCETFSIDAIRYDGTDIYDAIIDLSYKEDFEKTYQYVLSTMELLDKEAAKPCDYMYFMHY